jgi:hypothetical protein
MPSRRNGFADCFAARAPQKVRQRDWHLLKSSAKVVRLREKN